MVLGYFTWMLDHCRFSNFICDLVCHAPVLAQGTKIGFLYPANVFSAGVHHVPRITFGDDTTFYQVLANTTISANNWHYIVGSYNGAELRVYVDGVLSNTTFTTATPFSTGTQITKIGCLDGSASAGIQCANNVNGSVGHVAVYDRVLSESQIYALFENRTGIITSQETSSGDVWQACVTPNDGYVDGNQVCSNNITILASNTVPSIGAVVLNSTDGSGAIGNNATRDENLTIFTTNVTDNDGDSIVNITDWKANGLSLALVNMPFETEVNAVTADAITDYSDNSNDGTLGAGTGSQAPVWNASGQVGAAYTFDGVDDRISLGDITTLDGQSAMSFGAWINPNDYAPGTTAFDLRNIITKGALAGDNTNSIWSMFQGNGAGGHHFQCGFDTDGSFRSVTVAAENFTIGEWTHFMCTWADGQPVRLYVNGGLIGEDSALSGTILNVASPLLIGGSSDGSEDYFNGSIDEVIIYRSASPLEAPQIRNFYEEGLLGRHIANYDMTAANVGDVLFVDVTPNDHTGDGVAIRSNNVTIVNEDPSIAQVIINSTFGTNTSVENLTRYVIGVSDLDGDSIKNVTGWRLNTNSFAVLNMPMESFEGNESSVAIDYSTYQNNGSIINATFDSTAGVDGFGAYEFNGLNSYISIPHSSSLDFNAANLITVSAWIYPKVLALSTVILRARQSFCEVMCSKPRQSSK